MHEQVIYSKAILLIIYVNILLILFSFKVKRKRTVIGRILDVVRLIGRLNLSFRGHRENETSTNKRIFTEIIDHFSKNGNIMDFHLKNAKGLWSPNTFYLLLFSLVTLILHILSV